MKAFAPISVVSALAIASSACAQLITTTFTWVDGNTVVLSVSTNPLLGIATTVTVSTIFTGATASTTTNTALTTATTTTARTATTTTARTRTTATTNAVTTTDADGDTITTTTGQRVVGTVESLEPMRTTTYWYDPGSGVWTSAVWTASVTAEPTAVTAIVPAGTIADYESYQSSINANIFASAEAANKSSAATAAGRGIGLRAWAWAGVVGAVGAGVLAVAL